MAGEQENAGVTESFDAVVIGAGFAGLYMLHRLRGLGLSARVYEAGDGVGGTWYWNRYPGARCDTPSHQYSFSFDPELEQEWVWTERYATQAEILRYLNHVADRYDLRRDIRLGTRVTSAHYDETIGRWRVVTDRGDQVTAAFCITAVGCLSAPNVPAIPGLETFAGPVYHTGAWPHQEVDFTGVRVGLIGTGSSGIQITPQLARQAARLVVFQRTPNYSLPAYNRPLTDEERAQVKARYRAIRERDYASSTGLTFDFPEPPAAILDLAPEERERRFELAWSLGGFAVLNSFTDTGESLDANALIAEFVRRKIRAAVRDTATAELLTPTDHPIGAKRPCVDIGYFETFNREHVTLVDVRRSPIETVTPEGVRTRDAEYPLDALVLATGFDAITGALLKIDVRGRGGVSLREAWAAGPKTYLGLMVAGFPNLFTITGPTSPSVLTNVPMAIEQHVDWIAGCLADLRARSASAIEATPAAQEEWGAHVNELAAGTLFPLASSWYLGANIPGKPRAFLAYTGGLHRYRRICDEIAAEGYRGFVVG